MFGAILLTVMGCNDYSLVERPDVIINEDTGLVVPPTVVPPADAPIAEASPQELELLMNSTATSAVRLFRVLWMLSM